MKKRSYRLIACILTMILLASGCQKTTVPGGNTSSVKTDIGLQPGDDKAFNTFLMEIFADNITSDSITFHYTLEHPENYGIAMVTPTLGNLDLSTAEVDKQANVKLLEELHKFDEDKLSDRQQLIYDILEYTIDNSIKSYDYLLYSTIFSPTTGIQAQLPVILNEYIFHNKEDVDDYIFLLKDLKNYYRELLDYEKAKSEAGLFMADFTVDAIVAQCEEFIKTPEENLLIDIFDDKLTNELPDLTDKERTDYIRQNHDAVIDHVIPAYEMLIGELTALKGTGTNDAGLAGFEDGQEYYAYMAAANTGSSKSMDEMIDMTMEALTQDITQMSIMMMQNPELLEEIESFSPDISDPSTVLTNLQTAILDQFPEPISKTFSVKYVHESLEQDMSPAFYMIPAIDSTDSNRIYINNYYNSGVDNASFFSTLAHEGYPGHLYQTTWFYNTNPHPIYSIFSHSGYSEGWATYVEKQSYGWAGANENLAQLLSINLDINLALSARVDMGVNYEGWSRQDTVDFLLNNFGLPAESAEELFEYVVAEPGVYLPYFIGSLEFEALRAMAEEKLKDQFDPISYHKFILDLGPAPFDIIEEYLKEWLDNAESIPNAA